MDSRATEVLKQGDKLFSDKGQIDSLWQEIALNFYPERADFTDQRSQGEEYADHLFSSYPSMARRELANLMAASLRPRSDKWFSIHVDNEEIDERDQERAFLEYLTDIQWRAMYDQGTGFVRATKQADHDFASFGNAVIKYGPNQNLDGLYFRNYHLRDCAWTENAEGKVDCLHRNWAPTARQLVEQFPKTASSDAKNAAEKDPNKEMKCRHVVMPSRLHKLKNSAGKEFPFVSLYVERGTDTILEEVGLRYFCYVVPRWQTIANSVYGVSMATMVLLPDSRTLQVMTRTLREAGEKYVDPPMIAISDAIRGDIALYAGGVTIAEMEYDEKTGDVLRPVTQDRSGFPIGLELAMALREDIRQGFFLDKIQLPEAGGDMTAYEVRRRLEEHIRASSPIFEPIEQEYNDPLCEGVFEVLRQYNAFPMDQVPESLMGADIQFQFRSPLSEMAEQREAESFVDGMQRILMPIAEIDPAQMEQVNLSMAVRDAMRASGWKQKWFNPVEAVEQKRAQLAEQQQLAEAASGAGAAAGIAETGGKALQELGKAGVEV